MDAVSLSSNTRAALNGADGNAQVTALKIAAQSEKAIANMLEQSVEATKALAPAGQGRLVDKSA
ncbi:MAG: hypothetical protein ACRCTI_03025 [Beijerinckiaceae bacterium]